MMDKQETVRGSVLLVVLVFMAIFGALAVGYLAAANADMQASRLYLQSRRAHFAAETGLNLVRDCLPGISVEDAETVGETLQALADGLNERFQDNIFAGQLAGVSGSSLQLPTITLSFPEGVAYLELQISASSGDQYRVWSLGITGNCRQRLMLDFQVQHDMLLLTNFGVASKSRIRMLGNAQIIGANDPVEGSVLSTTLLTLDPIDITGHVLISGNAAISNPDGSVSYKGNSRIDGEVRIGVQEPPFPTIDTSIFEPYATNIVDSGTDTSGDSSFENIRILAGTNPTFSGHPTIHGVVYIESPNVVTFVGGVDIVGVVVVEPPDDVADFANHSIVFGGNSSAESPSNLPAGSQFDGLRDLVGSFLLAPGYEVSFTGNFSTINGSIAASKIDFSGNATSTIIGSVLNLHDTDFTISGNACITIDHSQLGDPPAGMIFPRKLNYLSGSYGE